MLKRKKQHKSLEDQYNSLLEYYVRGLPIEIRAIVNVISTNSEIDILSRKLINELKKKYMTNKLDADSVVEIFYLLSSKYNDMSNENEPLKSHICCHIHGISDEVTAFYRFIKVIAVMLFYK